MAYLMMFTETQPQPKSFRDDTFAESYEFIACIGEGGYGKVYSAIHHHNQTQHAVKVIPNDKCRHKTYCPCRDTNIPDEVLLWEELDHPGIVKLQAIYYEADSWILVMEYEPQFVDLFYYIDQHGVMTSSEAAHILRQLLDICSYLALQGVDHRDIKDENILYNPSTKQIKLIDFGSASLLTSAQYTFFRGTDVYIPPEFWTKGHYYPCSATVFSIGCLAYILLNGDSPFDKRQDVINFTGKLESLQAYTNLLGEVESDFIKGCLCPDPFLRPSLPELVGHMFLQ